MSLRRWQLPEPGRPPRPLGAVVTPERVSAAPFDDLEPDADALNCYRLGQYDAAAQRTTNSKRAGDLRLHALALSRLGRPGGRKLLHSVAVQTGDPRFWASWWSLELLEADRPGAPPLSADTTDLRTLRSGWEWRWGQIGLIEGATESSIRHFARAQRGFLTLGEESAAPVLALALALLAANAPDDAARVLRRPASTMAVVPTDPMAATLAELCLHWPQLAAEERLEVVAPLVDLLRRTRLTVSLVDGIHPLEVRWDVAP